MILSIVIPAYNEARRLPPNLPRVGGYCAALDLPPAAEGPGYEVLVVVERSSDETLALSTQAAAPYPQIKVIDNLIQRGKGYAVRSGMLRAAGDVVFFMDADLSTPLEEIRKFLDYFAAHPEVDGVIGNRRHKSSHIGKRQSYARRNLSKVFNFLVSSAGLLPGGLADTQCGFKAFRRAAVQEIFSRQKMDGFSFDVEVLALASALGLRVVDLPVAWYDEAATRVHLWRDGWKMLRDLQRVRATVKQSLREQPLQRPAGA